MYRRLRVQKPFGERLVPSEARSPKPVYVISIAGEGKTEEQYFDGISDLVTDGLIYIERLQKEESTDTKSHPKYVLELLIERSERWKEYGVSADELWMVVDRDKQNVSTEQLQQIINECDKLGFMLALSSPAFELWLLLHFTDLRDYNKQTIFENPKLRGKSKKRYLDTEIAKIAKGYSKRKINFTKFKPGIKDAIKRAKMFPLDNLRLLGEPGTTVCLLVEKLIETE